MLLSHYYYQGVARRGRGTKSKSAAATTGSSSTGLTNVITTSAITTTMTILLLIGHMPRQAAASLSRSSSSLYRRSPTRRCWSTAAFIPSSSSSSSSSLSSRSLFVDCNTKSGGGFVTTPPTVLPQCPTTRNSHFSSLSSTSSSSSNPQKQPQKTQKKSPNTSTTPTNKLHNLPTIPHPNTLLQTARKTALKIKPSPTHQHNALLRARKHATQTIDALTTSLTVPTRDIVKGYTRELRRLHPFERTVADLTVIAREKRDGVSLEGVLGEVGEGRKELLLASKDWIARAKNAPTAREAGEVLTMGTERMLELFQELVAEPLLKVMELQNAMGKTPVVKLDAPAVVLVGAPNVGKSSIVRAISSGTPEIGDYPFTTRGMTMGHVRVSFGLDGEASNAEDEDKTNEMIERVGNDDGGNYAFTQLCQVMDSPGLLNRLNEERNEMEALTLAAMEHLPTAVMYVMDLSGGAGDKCSSVADQLVLRREVRARFPRRPWIDVVSKCDLGWQEGAQDALREVLEDDTQYLEVSVRDGTGVQDLKDEVMTMLGEVRVVLDAMAAMKEQQSAESARTS